jgi:hypothetical protein
MQRMKLELAPVTAEPAEHAVQDGLTYSQAVYPSFVKNDPADAKRAASAADVFTSGAAFDCIFAYSGQLNYLFFALVCKSWRDLYNGRAATAEVAATAAAAAATTDEDKTSAKSTLVINALMSTSKLQMALENGLDLATSAAPKTQKLVGKYCPLEVLLYAHERGLQWSKDLNHRAARAGIYVYMLKHYMQYSYIFVYDTALVSHIQCFLQLSITSLDRMCYATASISFTPLNSPV